MDNIKVMIVDDMPQVVEYYKMIIEGEPGMTVVATANSGKEVIPVVDKYRPNVVLMDVQMETDDAGIIATKTITDNFTDVKVIVLTSHENSENIANSFSAGASDFLTNNSSLTDIISAIKNAVHDNKNRLNVNAIIANELKNANKMNESLLYLINLMNKLSKGEMDILKLLCKGYSYRQISLERCVEEVTIRSMINKIKKKLQVDSMRKFVQTLNELKVIEFLG